jgi:hypothetical protein
MHTHTHSHLSHAHTKLVYTHPYTKHTYIHAYTQTHTHHLLGLPSLGANHLYSILTTGTGGGGGSDIWLEENSWCYGDVNSKVLQGFRA